MASPSVSARTELTMLGRAASFTPPARAAAGGGRARGYAVSTRGSATGCMDFSRSSRCCLRHKPPP